VNETDVRDTTLAREVEEHHGDRRHVGDDHESCEIDQHERQHAHVDLAQRRVEYRLRSWCRGRGRRYRQAPRGWRRRTNWVLAPAPALDRPKRQRQQPPTRRAGWLLCLGDWASWLGPACDKRTAKANKWPLPALGFPIRFGQHQQDTSAVDLKFLSFLRHVRLGTSNPKPH
jgi:hypothetical protein